MKVNYKVLLVLWIAFGVAISGYKMIYPTTHEERVDLTGYEPYYRTVVDETSYYVPILVTVVGTILIGGLGYVLSERKKSSLF